MAYRKYRAIPTVVNGIRFASKKEAAAYWVLFMRQKAGEISNLELQPKFKFPCGPSYIADLRYIEKGKSIIIDAKGVQTPVFRLKMRMFKMHYPDLDLRIV